MENHLQRTSDYSADIREKAGLRPHTEVSFEFDGKETKILPVRTAANGGRGGRGARLVAHLRGRGDIAMTTDEIMALTRAD